jgi:hypothetical protein
MGENSQQWPAYTSKSVPRQRIEDPTSIHSVAAKEIQFP